MPDHDCLALLRILSAAPRGLKLRHHGQKPWFPILSSLTGSIYSQHCQYSLPLIEGCISWYIPRNERMAVHCLEPSRCPLGFTLGTSLMSWSSLVQHSPIHPSSRQCTDTMHPITDMGDAACQRGDQVCGQPAVKDLSCSLKMCPVPIAHLSKPNTPISLRHVAQTCHNTAPYGRPLYLHCTVGPPWHNEHLPSASNMSTGGNNDIPIKWDLPVKVWFQ